MNVAKAFRSELPTKVDASQMRTRLRWMQLAWKMLKLGREVLPLGERGRVALIIGLPVDEVALRLKPVGCRCVDGGKFL